jgi:uncharacterized protein YcbK (DUF882 family)
MGGYRFEADLYRDIYNRVNYCLMKLTENFSLAEFACKDGSPVPQELIPNVQLLAENLQVLRDFLGEPIHVNSGYRTPAYNAKIGGEPNSFHKKAMASDITVKSKTPKQLHTIIEKLIAEKKMKQGGLGLYPGFVHYDVRGTKARW